MPTSTERMLASRLSGIGGYSRFCMIGHFFMDRNGVFLGIKRMNTAASWEDATPSSVDEASACADELSDCSDGFSS